MIMAVENYTVCPDERGNSLIVSANPLVAALQRNDRWCRPVWSIRLGFKKKVLIMLMTTIGWLCST